MHRVKLSVRSVDRELLVDNDIEPQHVQNLLELALNVIKPSKRKRNHSIRLVIVDEDFSYYTFSNVINITKHCFHEKTKNKRWYKFFNDLMHEMCHYIQFKIDNVSITKFFVEHETSSHTKYLNNATERQARRHGNVAREITALYTKLQKVRVNDIKSISKLDEKGKDKTCQERKADHP